METLQSVVMPNLHVPGAEDMYVRLNDRATCELGRARLRFADGGVALTDTYYGALSVRAWKQHCQLRSLVLALEGEGQFLLTFGVHRLGAVTLWLSEHEVTLVPGRRTHVPLRGWDGLKDGLLFFRLRALGPGVLDSARYATADPAPNDVTLGIVVTHFNRQAQVLPAIERIRAQVLQRPELQGRITLTVVDNSRNLSLDTGDGVTVIPNRNLGGTGGFVRGLLSLEDGGRHTHALFMDDDASCEAECILRTYALLRYAHTPRLAVAGSLLAENEPWHLTEKGARFDGRCHPLHAGLDMRNLHHLLMIEQSGETADYGGWWFFAFPIAEVRRYPFPFFVRGDDVFFSLTNRFELLTMNGIACLGEEFRLKHGPMTAYLDARYHILHALMAEDRNRDRLLRVARILFLKPLLAYHYASARAFTLALRHVTQGPQFFRDNMDLAQVRQQIGAWTPSEKMQPVDRRGLRLRGPRQGRESGLRKLLRALTLQGFLLPGPLLRNRVQVQEKAFAGDSGSAFRFRRVLYHHWQSDTGYIAEHDKRLFFAELRDFLKVLGDVLRRLPQLRRELSQGFEQMTTEQFWREVYALPARPAALTPTAVNEGTPKDPMSAPRPIAVPTAAVSKGSPVAGSR